MSSPPYVDTSALAKWYLPESGSDAVESWIRSAAPIGVSGLTLVELRSLLARRRRERTIGEGDEMRVLAAVEMDLHAGHARRLPWSGEGAFDTAAALIARCVAPLRTLDALHLVAALDSGASVFATADRAQADAAVELGFDVVRFDAR